MWSLVGVASKATARGTSASCLVPVLTALFTAAGRQEEPDTQWGLQQHLPSESEKGLSSSPARRPQAAGQAPGWGRGSTSLALGPGPQTPSQNTVKK